MLHSYDARHFEAPGRSLIGATACDLESYTEVSNLRYLRKTLNRSLLRFKRLNKGIIDIIEDYNLVSFHALNINVRLLHSTVSLLEIVVYIN
jgi:hypothetical protein